MRVVRVTLVVIAVLLAGTMVAGAQPVTVTTKKLGAGSTSVSSCGSLSASAVTFNAKAGTLVGLTVRNLPVACNGGTLQAAATNSGGTDLGHGGPVTVAGGIAAVTSLSASPATSSVAQVRIVVAGP